jgi:GTP-binding protein Era
MKSGFAVIIGRSNVGKSTLINSLVGTKVSITTPKPQTTRRPLQGILTTDAGQVVFVDTPGLMQKAGDPLTKKLTRYISESLQGIDLILYVVDATRSIGAEEKKVMQMIEPIQVPKLLLINKTDDEASRTFIDAYRDLMPKFDGAVEISAFTGSNLDLVKKWIFERLPEGDLLYPNFDVSNLSKEGQLAELIREKLFLRLREEVPYSTHVIVSEIDQRKNGTMYVKGTIFTSEERYKGMIIGQGGRGIREIGQSVRNELEAVTGKQFYLELDVQVDRNWVGKLE